VIVAATHGRGMWVMDAVPVQTFAVGADAWGGGCVTSSTCSFASSSKSTKAAFLAERLRPHGLVLHRPISTSRTSST
jgi:hypothetical protein